MVDKYGFNRGGISIPKVIHVIWVGDESKRPNHFINSWVDQNPDWEVKVWGNDILANHNWYNAKHIKTLLECGRLDGVSDMMRYEILFIEGGFYVDADCYCIRPLEDWLFDSDICLGWEHEQMRPGLIGNNVMAAAPQQEFMAKLIERIHNRESITDGWPCHITGPRLVTEIHQENPQYNYTLWPSHYFTPVHNTGARYTGQGHVFADHVWGTTKGHPQSVCDIVID
ncbi:MAG: glycosyltransferase [Zymomonas mobilis]|uniref:glycosyltransferase family 32 protein n=1 Tax=Zymomonas mobilis TaxID=542 RepID=UPI0001B70444|nr:glycosyltransferase [Zymomonas mobilis]ACV75236.1 conserved hypothetical protein [Zymomonas mobilis subsp. mobilis NCIMB 11163]ART93182.1 hypothetical protein B9T50_03090 [Zymomonas mobilis subsp. mobilis]TWD59860.1 glycosyl transferase-like sugar-binding protein [Zymomonas mobilis]